MQSLCPNCGKRIPAHALVCPECGEGVRRAHTEINPLEVIDHIDIKAEEDRDGMQGYGLTSLDLSDEFEFIEPGSEGERGRGFDPFSQQPAWMENSSKDNGERPDAEDTKASAPATPRESLLGEWTEQQPAEFTDSEPEFLDQLAQARTKAEAELADEKAGLLESGFIPRILGPDHVPAVEGNKAPEADGVPNQAEDEADASSAEARGRTKTTDGKPRGGLLFDGEDELFGDLEAQDESELFERTGADETWADYRPKESKDKDQPLPVFAQAEGIAGSDNEATAMLQPMVSGDRDSGKTDGAPRMDRAANPGFAGNDPLQETTIMPPLGSPDSDVEDGGTGRGKLFVLLITAVIALALVLIGWFACSHNAAGADEHRVTFPMSTPGYNSEATAIPVQVSGTTAQGKEFDQLVFLDGGGNGIILEPGTYQLSFPGGSILANGTVLVAPEDTKLDVEVPTGLAKNQFVQLDLEEAVSYTAITPLDTTDEVLEEVHKYAVQNPSDPGKANALRDNAKSVHEEAVEKKEKDSADLQKEATKDLHAVSGDMVDFLGTVRIMTAEELSNELEDENVLWNFYDRTLAVLMLDEPREVSMEPDAGGYYYYNDEGEIEDDVYSVRLLLLNSDMTGIYGEADDGTLGAYDGKRVLVSGKIYRTSDWASSLIAPVNIPNPEFEEL